MTIPADQLQTAIDFAAGLFRDSKHVVALKPDVILFGEQLPQSA